MKFKMILEAEGVSARALKKVLLDIMVTLEDEDNKDGAVLLLDSDKYSCRMGYTTDGRSPEESMALFVQSRTEVPEGDFH